MEILLPYYDYYTQPSRASTNYHHPATGSSTQGIGTMRRTVASTNQTKDARLKKDYPSESDSDDVDATDERVGDDEQETKIFVQEPQPYDVLCGHDRNYSKHPGNQAYRKLIEAHASIYSTDLPKQEKMNITRSILSTMEHQYGGRFLRRCCDNSNSPEPGASTAKKRAKTTDRSSSGVNNSAIATAWQVMTHVGARDKISHALRNEKKKKRNVTNGDPIGTGPGTGGDTFPPLIPMIGIGNGDNVGIGTYLPISSPINIPGTGGYYGSSLESIDDPSLSFDDPNTYLNLFGKGDGKYGSPSVSAATLNTNNDIHYDDTYSNAFSGVNPSTTKTTRKRKGS